MDENITAKNISRRFSGIQHTILRWNEKELDDGLFVNVFPINYESWCVFEGEGREREWKWIEERRDGYGMEERAV